MSSLEASYSGDDLGNPGIRGNEENLTFSRLSSKVENARDPYPEEIASLFGDKVLGNQSTEHKILIPNASLQCSPVSPSQTLLSADDARKLLHKILGWSIVEDEAGGLKIRCMCKVRDFGYGVELINRIHKVAEASVHFPSLHLESHTQVRADYLSRPLAHLL
ncbi:hypothetical protein Bca101_031754 [Brassica carinata]